MINVCVIPTVFCNIHIYFCQNNDENIHTLMSKQTHQRSLISSIEQNKELIVFPFVYGSGGSLPKESAITITLKV